MKTVKPFFGEETEYDRITIKDNKYKLSFWNKLKYAFSSANIYCISKIYLDKKGEIITIQPDLFIGSREGARENSFKLMKK